VLREDQFGLFQDDHDGPLWRASFAELDEAKRRGQEFADDEGREFFVYCFRNYSEVARLLPSRRMTQA
jgi:hypothetical protein